MGANSEGPSASWALCAGAHLCKHLALAKMGPQRSGRIYHPVALASGGSSHRAPFPLLSHQWSVLSFQSGRPGAESWPRDAVLWASPFQEGLGRRGWFTSVGRFGTSAPGSAPDHAEVLNCRNAARPALAQKVGLGSPLVAASRGRLPDSTPARQSR